MDATSIEAVKLGGIIIFAPMDISNVGRFAVVKDPSCGAFAIYYHYSPYPDEPEIPAVGSFCGMNYWPAIVKVQWNFTLLFSVILSTPKTWGRWVNITSSWAATNSAGELCNCRRRFRSHIRTHILPWKALMTRPNKRLILALNW